MVTVPHIMVETERMLDYRDVGLVRFHCMHCHCPLPTIIGSLGLNGESLYCMI